MWTPSKSSMTTNQLRSWPSLWLPSLWWQMAPPPRTPCPCSATRNACTDWNLQFVNHGGVIFKVYNKLLRSSEVCWNRASSWRQFGQVGCILEICTIPYGSVSSNYKQDPAMCYPILVIPSIMSFILDLSCHRFLMEFLVDWNSLMSCRLSGGSLMSICFCAHFFSCKHCCRSFSHMIWLRESPGHHFYLAFTHFSIPHVAV